MLMYLTLIGQLKVSCVFITGKSNTNIQHNQLQCDCRFY